MRSALRLILTAAIAVLVPGPAAAGETYAPGEKLALQHCGRCHVVSPKNRMGSIGSTPSFATMRNRADFEDRLRAFYTLRPHPAFTQVVGVTPPFPQNRPSPIVPLVLTEAEIDTIARYAMTIPPMDLGAVMRTR